MKPYLSGIAFYTGTIKPITDLQQSENLNAETIESLHQRGLKNFCDSDINLPEMCVLSILKSLEDSSLSPTQIDAIILSNSNSHWSYSEETALITALHDIGFNGTRIIGISLQGCGASSTALRIASNLINEQGTINNILIVITGKISKNQSRLAPQAATIFSDGVVSCILSSEEGKFKLLANENLMDTAFIASMKLETNKFGRYVESGFRNLNKVCDQVLKEAGISASKICKLFGTNGSTLYLEWMAAAARLPIHQVYADDLAKYAHLHSCDNLVSLKNYMDSYSLQMGEHYLLLSWSPHTVSASILEYTAYK